MLHSNEFFKIGLFVGLVICLISAGYFTAIKTVNLVYIDDSRMGYFIGNQTLSDFKVTNIHGLVVALGTLLNVGVGLLGVIRENFATTVIYSFIQLLINNVTLFFISFAIFGVVIWFVPVFFAIFYSYFIRKKKSKIVVVYVDEKITNWMDSWM